MRLTHIASWMGAASVLCAPLLANAGSFDGNTNLCSDGSTQVGQAMNAVESAIGAGSFTRPADRTNLLIKLGAANAKALESKPGDAIVKLEDISNTAGKLADAAKPKLADDTAIQSTVLDAVHCLTYPLL